MNGRTAFPYHDNRIDPRAATKLDRTKSESRGKTHCGKSFPEAVTLRTGGGPHRVGEPWIYELPGSPQHNKPRTQKKKKTARIGSVGPEAQSIVRKGVGSNSWSISEIRANALNWGRGEWGSRGPNSCPTFIVN